MAKNCVYAWHLLPENGMTRYSNLPVKPGVTLIHKDKIELCASGLHASINLQDALSFAPGPILCRVKCEGIILKGEDKIVATKRTVVYMFDASRMLRLFACWCGRNTKLADGRTVWDLLTDPRSRKAVEVAERYANGQATKGELAAAGAAARAAARAAAGDAAWAAAGAAAGDAAWAQLEKMAIDEAKYLGVYQDDN